MTNTAILTIMEKGKVLATTCGWGSSRAIICKYKGRKYYIVTKNKNVIKFEELR